MTLTTNNNIRKQIRSWLITHPKLNPYKWFDPGIFRTVTSPFRVLPDFLIIGMQKSGSSALYDYIIRHPDVYPALRKETHFFDLDMGKRWYRSYFPSIFTKFYVTKIKKKSFVTGEATPNYTFFPYCAKKILRFLPKAKFIVILRNPVDRAFSHYQMKVRKKQEGLTFEEGLLKEEERLRRSSSMSDTEYYNSKNFNRYAYSSRGIYVEQLKIWLELFSKKQFLFISTEELEKNETEIMKKVFRFLDLEPMNMKNLEKIFPGNYSATMKIETRKKLIEFFKPYNKQLYELIGEKFDWDR